MLRKADGGDHRIQAKHDIEQHYLYNGTAQRQLPRSAAMFVFLRGRQLFAYLLYRFINQEQPAPEQNQRAERNLQRQHGKKRLGNM